MTLLDIKKKCMEDAAVYLEALPENGLKELREAIKKAILEASQQETKQLYVVQILWLHTPFYFGEARLGIYGYEKDSDVRKPMVETSVSCEWLMVPFRACEERLQAYQEAHDKTREWLRYEVRELVTVYWKLVAFFIKYPIRDLFLEEEMQEIPKASNFSVEFGQREGFRLLVHMDTDEIQLIDEQDEEMLRFRKYTGKRFRNARIQNKNLSNSIFTDCKFESFVFDNDLLNDCIFRNCIFQRTHFLNGTIYGTLFENCRFTDTETKEVATVQETITEEGLYRGVSLVECGEESYGLF